MANQPLGATLDHIGNQTDLLFVYNDDLVLDKYVTYSAENSSPNKVLTEICEQADISHKMFGKNTIVLFKDSPPETNEKNKKLVKVSATPVVSNLKLLSSNQPKYPIQAVSKNIEGTVTVKMLISNSGEVINVQIDKSSGSKILDNHTVDFVKNLIYKPLKINNQPRTSWTYISYSYILTKN